AIPSYTGSVEEATCAMSPKCGVVSSTSSSTAVTVTVCGVNQSSVVKVSVETSVVICAFGVTETSTLAVGSEVSTTVYVSELGPVSSTSVEPLDSTMETPAVSSSSLITSTFAGSSPL